MKKFLSLLLLSGVLVSCQDDSEKAATELCDCFTEKVKKPSADFKKLMKKIAQADVPSAAFKKEFDKLDDETQTSVRAEIDKLIETDASSVKACTKNIADYKVRGKDEETRAKKVVDLMAAKSGCEIASGQWAMAVEQTYKGGKKTAGDEDTAEEETDEPKKKKKATEEEE